MGVAGRDAIAEVPDLGLNSGECEGVNRSDSDSRVGESGVTVEAFAGEMRTGVSILLRVSAFSLSSYNVLLARKSSSSGLSSRSI